MSENRDPSIPPWAPAHIVYPWQWRAHQTEQAWAAHLLGQEGRPPGGGTNTGCLGGIAILGIAVLLICGFLASVVGVFETTAGHDTSVQEPLTTPSADWVTDGQNCLFENDGYHVVGASLCHYSIGRDFADADVLITVATLSGDPTCASGFFFRAPSDGSGFYTFVVAANGQWEVAKYTSLSASANLVAPRANRAIRTGLGTKNRIRVVMKGGHFDFYVNGTKVGQVDDNDHPQGELGVTGCDKSDVVYTDFQMVVTS